MALFSNIMDYAGANPPQRMVSLVPSITETLYDLGLADRVVGITKFCVHPHQWYIAKKRVGGTKNINIKGIKDLEADLVIANHEENVAEQVRALASFTQVWVTHIVSFSDAMNMITDAGKITHTSYQAQRIVQDIILGFKTLEPTPKQCAYLIWKNPYMAAGGDTFIHQILTLLGFNNVFANALRYPATDWHELKALSPDIVFLSSEPYPFKQKHLEELRNQIPDSRFFLVDGEMFSWYGSRLKYAPEYFKQLHSVVNQSY